MIMRLGFRQTIIGLRIRLLPNKLQRKLVKKKTKIETLSKVVFYMIQVLCNGTQHILYCIQVITKRIFFVQRRPLNNRKPYIIGVNKFSKGDTPVIK
jgi:hypothetical protein